MGTREEGARIATAETVTFLDSHIEVNEGWLEPMLARIKEDRRHAVMPIIDSIDPDTFRCVCVCCMACVIWWSLCSASASSHVPMRANELCAVDKDIGINMHVACEAPHYFLEIAPFPKPNARFDASSIRYRAGGLDILGFSWSLGQKGMSRTRSRDEPMPSPVMAGGLSAMDRRLFFKLAGYDPEMKLYGGEEMKISFRLWMCGNTLECIPCSRVGHVFRTGRFWQGQVYTVPGDVIIRNKLRAAYIWLDQ